LVGEFFYSEYLKFASYWFLRGGGQIFFALVQVVQQAAEVYLLNDYPPQ
jgi:hypothetical protein